MKPLKGIFPLAKWLLRLSLLSFIYLVYFDFILNWDFTNIEYITILSIAFFSVLLIFGGFMKKNSLSVISGLIIFLLSILKIILSLPEIEAEMIFFSVIGLYFMSSGNYLYRR